MSTPSKDSGTSRRDAARDIAHDLRARLNGMRLGLDMLRRGLDRDDAGSEEFRNDQLRQIERLDRQVSALSDVASRLVDIDPALDEDATS